MNPRLSGVGFVPIVSSYIGTIYYTVMLAWSLLYCYCSFIKPLPWSVDASNN